MYFLQWSKEAESFNTKPTLFAENSANNVLFLFLFERKINCSDATTFSTVYILIHTYLLELSESKKNNNNNNLTNYRVAVDQSQLRYIIINYS